MKLDQHQRSMKREQPRPGKESVCDYPRPRRLEPSAKTVIVSLAGQEIAKTSKAYRSLETSHPPTWYLPPDSVRQERLIATPKRSFCEWTHKLPGFLRLPQEIGTDTLPERAAHRSHPGMSERLNMHGGTTAPPPVTKARAGSGCGVFADSPRWCESTEIASEASHGDAGKNTAPSCTAGRQVRRVWPGRLLTVLKGPILKG